MSEVLKALEGITARVLGHHPKDKGLAAAKVKRKIDREERKAKRMRGSELYKSQSLEEAQRSAHGANGQWLIILS